MRDAVKSPVLAGCRQSLGSRVSMVRSNFEIEEGFVEAGFDELGVSEVTS